MYYAGDNVLKVLIAAAVDGCDDSLNNAIDMIGATMVECSKELCDAYCQLHTAIALYIWW